MAEVQHFYINEETSFNFFGQGSDYNCIST